MLPYHPKSMVYLQVGFLLWLSWKRIHLQCGRPGFDPWDGKVSWRRERLPTPVFWPGEFHGLCSPWGHEESDATERLSFSLFSFTHSAVHSMGLDKHLMTCGGFSGGASGKEPVCNAGHLRDTGSVPGLGRSPRGGHGNPLQYSCLEDSHGQRSLAGYSLWGHKESDTTGDLYARV